MSLRRISYSALIETPQHPVLIYDLDSSKCKPAGLRFEDLRACDVIFICVPTPSSLQEKGKCHTAIVERVIAQCKSLTPTCHIVVRTTVPVGFCAQHNVHFMPEFLTEKNWRTDFLTATEWIVGIHGGSHPEFEALMKQIALPQIALPSVKRVVFTSPSEAEAIKYFRNCFLATKVAFCNEFASFCKTLQLDYSTVSSIAAADARITLSHTNVPGHDGRKGFGGTCFPKDMASLLYQMESKECTSTVIKGAIRRNEEIDRPEKDWVSSEEFKGRASI
jgi:UDPglucose 6-dehydrogenase